MKELSESGKAGDAMWPAVEACEAVSNALRPSAAFHFTRKQRFDAASHRMHIGANVRSNKVQPHPLADCIYMLYI